MDLIVALLIVLAAGAVAAVALVGVRQLVGRPLLTDSGRGRPMIQVTGTMFAVLLAFVILAAFQTYNTAKSGAQSEASSVLDMSRTAALFPAPVREEMRGDFVCYGRAVVDREWPAMQDEDSDGVPLVDHWIGAYDAVFQHLTLTAPREQNGFQEILTLSNTRSAGRQQRLSDATPTVPTPLLLALLFGGVMTVALQLSMADRREWLLVQATLIAGIASVVAAGLLIVNFLDHPYQGTAGNLQPAAMHRTLAYMEGLDPTLPIKCGASGRPT